ncbi:hypothetical protein EVAR_57428_1 [Eumeta japonica]|uniref:Uncharacterized protein n=1 Tax=Eumeta variegata TaxID=151549 RepID=A0A4C1YDF9_EUMVA|nr:hypothetical protein EVAR_57428_1 [Eumeta japonica]
MIQNGWASAEHRPGSLMYFGVRVPVVYTSLSDLSPFRQPIPSYIRYPITIQEADNALVIPLEAQMPWAAVINYTLVATVFPQFQCNPVVFGLSVYGLMIDLEEDLAISLISVRSLMIKPEGGHTISSTTRHNPVVFGLVRFVFKIAIALYRVQVCPSNKS